MVNEFWRLQKEPVDPDELKGAQDFLAGNFPLTIESPGAIAHAGARAHVLRHRPGGDRHLSRSRRARDDRWTCSA